MFMTKVDGGLADGRLAYFPFCDGRETNTGLVFSDSRWDQAKGQFSKMCALCHVRVSAPHSSWFCSRLILFCLHAPA